MVDLNYLLNTIYLILSIVVLILGYFTVKKFMNKIENIKINQKAEKLIDVKGVDFKLANGEDIHIKNMDISQEAGEMRNVSGLSFNVEGQQSARLQGVKIRQPGVEITISDDPNVKVEINKHEYK